MIGQINIYGNDKVEQAIMRLKTFEPPEGYYLAFSGGKDSVVVKALADMAGVKYDAHYNVTSVDPPELYYFIRDQHPDVSRDIPHDKDGKRISMWSLIPNEGFPPTRKMRYCCAKLKENRAQGRFLVTGVRRAESAKRGKRGGLELAKSLTGKLENYDPDNPSENLIDTCYSMNRRTLNPIIDWTDNEVWEYIHQYNISYCELYDKGYKRLGCIGCPMSTHAGEELERYPRFKALYLKAFDKLIEVKKQGGKPLTWQTAKEIYDWWIQI